jgi:hypothetical protein
MRRSSMVQLKLYNIFDINSKFTILFKKYFYCSTDQDPEFSAPFKAGNSRQAQTCYILQKYNTKKIKQLTGSISIREM